MSLSAPVPPGISAVFPVCERLEEALRTIQLLKACCPPPAEIIVHVDGGRKHLAQTLAEAHPDVRVLMSEGTVHVGPGGARNALVAASKQPWVASFDDDSGPAASDFFARVADDVRLFPKAAAISAASLAEEKIMPGYMRIGIFSGCGCVFNRAVFMSTTGFVPLRVAYCMEEVDLSLRLHAMGGIIVHDPRLEVLHRKEAPTALTPELNAAIVGNIALFPALRYPWWLLPLVPVHALWRSWQMFRGGWLRGLGHGLASIPLFLWRHRSFRAPVSWDALMEWMRLRRDPECLRLFES